MSEELPYARQTQSEIVMGNDSHRHAWLNDCRQAFIYFDDLQNLIGGNLELLNRSKVGYVISQTSVVLSDKAPLRLEQFIAGQDPETGEDQAFVLSKFHSAWHLEYSAARIVRTSAEARNIFVD